MGRVLENEKIRKFWLVLFRDNKIFRWIINIIIYQMLHLFRKTLENSRDTIISSLSWFIITKRSTCPVSPSLQKAGYKKKGKKKGCVEGCQATHVSHFGLSFGALCYTRPKTRCFVSRLADKGQHRHNKEEVRGESKTVRVKGS